MKHLIAIVLFVAAALSGPASHGGTQLPSACEGPDSLRALQEKKPGQYQKMVARAAQIPNGTSLLWRIEKDGTRPSYLFGTYHSSSPKILELLGVIDEYLAASNIVAFELIMPVEPKEAMKFLRHAMRLATLPQGINLKDYLTDEEEQKITEAGQRVGLYGVVPFLLKPGMLIMTLSISECDLESMRSDDQFLDVKIQRLSDDLNVPLVALETLEEQVSALDGGSFDEQIKSLRHFLTLSDRRENMSNAFQQLYLKGQTGMLWAWSEVMSEDFLKEGQTFEEMMAPLLDDRNIRMVDRSEAILEEGGAFIAVGALHLPGKNGLVSLLRKEGYTVTAVY